MEHIYGLRIREVRNSSIVIKSLVDRKKIKYEENIKIINYNYRYNTKFHGSRKIYKNDKSFVAKK